VGKSQAKLEAFGIDLVCQRIGERMTLTDIAEQAGVPVSTFVTWLAADPERSARVREVRTEMAKVWDEQAEVEIRAAADDLGMKRARELAHHYRWRATKIAPRDYGDKIDVSASVTLESLILQSEGTKDAEAQH
jgi:hypothetical protein